MLDQDWLHGRKAAIAPEEALTRDVIAEAGPHVLAILAQRADEVFKFARKSANRQEACGEPVDPRLLTAMLAANRAVERVLQLGASRFMEAPADQGVDEELVTEERLGEVLAELERIAPGSAG